MAQNKNTPNSGDPDPNKPKRVNWRPVNKKDRAKAMKRQVISVSKGGHTVTMTEPTWMLFNECMAPIKEAVDYGRDDDNNVLIGWGPFKQGQTEKISLSKTGTSATFSGKAAFFPTETHLLQTTQCHFDVEKVMVDDKTECLQVIMDSARPAPKRRSPRNAGKNANVTDGQTPHQKAQQVKAQQEKALQEKAEQEKAHQERALQEQAKAAADATARQAEDTAEQAAATKQPPDDAPEDKA